MKTKGRNRSRRVVVGHEPLNRGSTAAILRYNAAIGRLAEENECLLADVWEAQGQADWLVHPDGVHANKVGNLVIAHRVFETIARHSSGLSYDTYQRDLQTPWSERLMNLRRDASDPFNRWWQPKPNP